MRCVRDGSDYWGSEFGEVQKLKIARDDKRPEPLKVFGGKHVARLEIRSCVRILLEPFGVVRTGNGLLWLCSVCRRAPQAKGQYQCEPTDKRCSVILATDFRASHNSSPPRKENDPIERVQRVLRFVCGALILSCV